MELKQALGIFGLNYDCTKEEVLKTYKRLIRKYHPDLYQNEVEKLELRRKQWN